MAKQVIKRDGTKEPFNGEKIRKALEVNVAEAGLSESRTKEVVEQVLGVVLELANGREEIATDELAEAVVAELDKIEPKAGESWRKYEEERHR